jgi:hypothetical protein
MRGSVLAAMAALVFLASCGTRLNPFNWFGGATEEPVAVDMDDADGAPADPRPLVDQVAALQVDRVPGGALVTAIGLPPTQGHFEAELVPTATALDGRPAPDDGVLTFRFVAVPPPGPRRSGTQASRELSAGVFLTDQTLAPVRTITVVGERNRRSARR